MSAPLSGADAAGLIPGEVLPAAGTIELNPGRPRLELSVENVGDRPIQVGSHYHFSAANPSLSFDRELAWGHRLDIPAGTSVRFEPGVSRTVSLVPLAGARVVPGLRPESAGPLDGRPTGRDVVSGDLTRARYAALYGPTTGDRVRLADTDLLIEVTEDRCGGPGPLAGDEAVFGGGKVIRESMGQSVATRAEGTPDLVITGRGGARPLGRGQGRRRHPGRSDRRARQGRQPRRHGRRDARAGDRSVHRGDRRQRQDPDRRWHRQPRASHCAATDPGRARGWHDDAHRRRDRSGREQQGHDGHLGRVLARRDDGRAHRLAGQRRAAGQGQHGLDRGAVGAAARRRGRLQAARGLGHAPRRPSTPA